MWIFVANFSELCHCWSCRFCILEFLVRISDRTWTLWSEIFCNCPQSLLAYMKIVPQFKPWPLNPTFILISLFMNITLQPELLNYVWENDCSWWIRSNTSLLQSRGERGTFEHFKSYGYLENFLKTTTTVMWKNHKPFVSHGVQFSCAVSGCGAAVVYFEV